MLCDNKTITIRGEKHHCKTNTFHAFIGIENNNNKNCLRIVPKRKHVSP